VVHVASRLAANPQLADPNDPSQHVDMVFLQKTGVADQWQNWQAACQGVSG